jgi:polyhydroxyalkanoate synthesis regulator phasin
MKARTLVELAAISAEKGKEKINAFVKEKSVDENGKEMDFLEKLASRIETSRHDMEERVGELVRSSYDRMHIVHKDEIEKISHQLETLKKELAIVHTKLNKQEKKEA